MTSHLKQSSPICAVAFFMVYLLISKSFVPVQSELKDFHSPKFLVPLKVHLEASSPFEFAELVCPQ